MNCSSSARQRRLQRLLVQLWRELLQGEAGAGAAPSNFSRRRPAGTDSSSPGPPPCWTWEEEAAAPGSHRAKGSAGGDDAYLYILLIMIFYGCLAGGLILAYTRSRKLESKHDPYHLYIERDWTGRPGDGGGESGKAAAMAMAPLLREASVDEVAAAAAAIGTGERRPSGDGEPL